MILKNIRSYTVGIILLKRLKHPLRAFSGEHHIIIQHQNVFAANIVIRQRTLSHHSLLNPYIFFPTNSKLGFWISLCNVYHHSLRLDSLCDDRLQLHAELIPGGAQSADSDRVRGAVRHSDNIYNSNDDFSGKDS